MNQREIQAGFDLAIQHINSAKARIGAKLPARAADYSREAKRILQNLIKELNDNPKDSLE